MSLTTLSRPKHRSLMFVSIWTTHKAFLKVVQVASEIPNGDQFMIWLWFRVYTGTRPIESYAVKWSDIGFDNDVIIVESKKGKQVEEVKTHPAGMAEEVGKGFREKGQDSRLCVF